MSIKSTYPSESPSLVLDFANSRKLDPRVSFDRAQTGNISTYMGPDGYIKYAGPDEPRFDHKLVTRTNYIKYSQSINVGASWSINQANPTGDTVTAPDGTTTADSFTSTDVDPYIQQTVNLPEGTYTWSIYLKSSSAVSSKDIKFRYKDSNNVYGASSIITITEEWKRYSFTFTTPSDTGLTLVRVDLPEISVSGDVIYVWGAQLEKGSTLTEYIPTTSEIVTVEYLESLGLLIEESRTNIQKIPTFRDSGSGTRFSINSTADQSAGSNTNDVVGPDGTANNVCRAFFTGSESDPDGSVYIMGSAGAVGASYTTTNTHTSSVWIRPGLETVWKIQAHSAYASASAGGSATGINFVFTLTGDGFVTSIESGGIAASVTKYPNNWYRCTLTYHRNSTATVDTNFGVIIYPYNYFSYNAESQTGDIGWFWGPQVEQGAFPTSYIPTSGSGVTRNADNAQILNQNFQKFYNQPEGTFVVESELIDNLRTATSFFNRFFQVSNSSLSVGLACYLDPTNNNAYVRRRIDDSSGNNVVLDNYFINQSPPPNYTNFSISYSDKNYAFCGNGEVVSINYTTTTHRTDNTILNIGRQPNNLLTMLNGTTRKLIYYPTRLSNAQLQTLTN